MNDAEIRFADWQATHSITTLKKRGLTPFIRSDGVLCLQGKHESSIYPLSDDHEIARRAARIIVERETKRNHAGETRPTIDGKSNDPFSR